MPLFKLGCHVTVSAYTQVQADTAEEALRIGRDREVVIGGLHSGADAGEQWVIEDADGDPTEVKVELPRT
jgi:hypothetical protein